MADKMVGYTQLDVLEGITMAAGERLLITIMPAGSTGVTGAIVYDGYTPAYTTLTGSVIVDARLLSYAPVISSLTADSYIVGPTGTATVTCIATDPAASPLSYDWSISGGTGTAGATGVLEWTATDEVGSFTIACTVTNASLAETTRSISVSTVSIPVISSVTAVPASVAPGGTSVVTCVATDPYVSPLTYIWSATGGTIFWNLGVATWTAPGTTGTYSISCLVSEAEGLAGATGATGIGVA